MKKMLRLSFFTFLSISLFPAILLAQNPGDTIVVQSFDYNANTRDTMVTFPNFGDLTFRQVLMQYNMRCHDANVNTTGGNGIACGEWDYSNNTYLHDPDRIDSLNATTPSHNISGFSGNSFDYTLTPTHTIYQTEQQTAIVNGVTNEMEYTVSSNQFTDPLQLPTTKLNAKTQLLYHSEELIDAGVQQGNIDALAFYVESGTATTNFFRVRLQQTDTFFDIGNPLIEDWTEVYFANTTIQPGQNTLQFTNGFEWDGSSNIAVEFSYNNSSIQGAIEIESALDAGDMSLGSFDDSHLVFNESNYLEIDEYKGIGGSDSRTMEAWIKTEIVGKEIVSWGTNNTGEKWVWRLEENGRQRIEIAGAGVVASTNVADGEWHHIAVVFEGANLSGVDFYVDGNLEDITMSSTAAVNTNNENGINVRISRGVNDRYFVGEIDEVRIWDTALSGNTIAEWKNRKISAGHQNYVNLLVHIDMNEGSGYVIENNLGGMQFTNAVNGVIWKSKKGVELFKDFEELGDRMRLTLFQGDYDLTINTTIVNDTVFSLPNPVTAFEIVPNYNTILSDDIVPASNTDYWEATENKTIDPDGTEISTTPVIADGTITITELPYIVRSASKIELMSFVTPYGIQLDLGPTGKTFTFDMTDYLPVFNGTKRLTMERGGQWQEEFDIKFLFIVGTSPRDVLDIQQIWPVGYKSYSDISNNNSFEPRDVATLASGDKFKVRSAISGHGQEGEFIPRIHYIDMNGGTNEFSWQVWKACGSNPIYPQGGTWIYDRAGWCPGAATDLVENDITQYITPGESVNIDYGINSASGTSNYIVSHQLVTYGEPNFEVDANLVEIQRPSNRVEFSRQGSVCNDPTIKIQNTGSTTLTSLTIKYWVNESAEPLSFQWAGSLEMMATEMVVLPNNDDLWNSINPENNVFHALLLSPNGAEDQNPTNDSYQSAFNIPDVVPGDFIIYFKTNTYASENYYEVKDVDGNVVFSRNNMINSTLYKDTLHLSPGCYTYFVYDNDGDGINFWANNDGNGYTRFKEVGGPIIKYLEPDFGDDIQYPFTIDFPLAYEEIENHTRFDIFPNPARNIINIELSGFDNQVDVMIYNSIGQKVYSERVKTVESNYSKTFDLANYQSGVYVVRINDGNKTATKKFVKE